MQENENLDQSDAESPNSVGSPTTIRLLSWATLRKKLDGRSYSSVRRDEIAGRFPRRVKIGPRAVRWIEHEVDQLIESLPRGCVSDKAPPQTRTDCDHQADENER